MGYPKFGRTLDEVVEQVREVNIEKGWRAKDGGANPGMTFGDYIALLHSEVSEALEAFRTAGLADMTDAERWNAAGLPKPEGVGSELADVLIRLVDMADVFGIDLEQEYDRKIAYNRTRDFRHGGKAL